MPRSPIAHTVLALLAVLLIRVPFLNQAIQGDDFYYLKGAEHALLDPLHPNHAEYVFQGDKVSMRGHPHPPLNAWYLAALLAVCGDVREPLFHAAYIPFSMLAALSVLSLARRFTAHPLAATLLFIATPAFVINGNSLEADVPFAAFFLAAIALFTAERYVLAAAAAALAALAAYQGIVLAPILAAWILIKRRPWLRAAPAILAAPAAIAAYQLFERLSSGALPATVLAGYMSTYGLQTLAAKAKNAAALTAHAGWLVFPALAAAAFRRAWIPGTVAAVLAAAIDHNPLFWVSAAIGVMLLAHAITHWRQFLCAWVVVFFIAALAIFFAGSARYLLPIAAPAAMLVADRVAPRWLYSGIAANAAIALLLTVVNYQHWNAYRSIQHDAPRVFTNAEWGLRHYLEWRGARPVERGQSYWTGDAVITSAYAAPPDNLYAAVVDSREIQSAIPLRIIGLGVRSGYSSVAFGLRPFDISRAPLDRVTTAIVTDRKVELSSLTIGTPEAAAQIVSGVFNNDRWTGGKATVMLKRPPNVSLVEAEFYIPPGAPARTVSLYADGRLLATHTFSGPGIHTIAAPAPAPAPPSDATSITFAVDQTFTVPPDQRRLGVILTRIGFTAARTQ